MLRAALLELGHPLHLAALRITVPAVVLLAPEVHRAAGWATLPDALVRAPAGLGPLLASFGRDPSLAATAHAVLIVSCVLTCVGLWSRASAAVAALSALYLLGLPQLGGVSQHNHHLVWLLALLAASPCGAAAALDARRAAPAGRSVACGLAVLFAWVLLLEVYFFPGMWKLRASGIEWIAGDSLRNLLHTKWFQQGEAPWLRIDRWPWLLHAGAAGVIVWEVGGPLFLLAPRLRWLWVAAAISFHLLADAFLGIRFTTLWLCFAFLLPLGRRAVPVVASRRRDVVAVAAVGAVLILGAGVAGLRGQTRGWPFACYPTFQDVAGPAMPALTLEVVRGSEVTSLLQRDWGSTWQAMAEGADRPRRLEAWLRRARPPGIEDAERLRFVQTWHLVEPERWDEPPRERQVLHESDGDVALPQRGEDPRLEGALR